jgi:formate-dependent nitrite reductase membrane component NrfD
MSAAGGTADRAAAPGARRDSYYGQPVIKEPVWTPEIPWYFFAGGLGGASATLAFLCERSRPRMARRTWLTALLALTVSPALLISDLGKPSRFLNMLRMFKVTSPMSVGSWVLAASGTTTGVVSLHLVTGRFRLLARLCRPIAALLGLPLSTYTGALIAQTAVPVWHEARKELPALFAAGAAVSAGAAATAISPLEEAGPARRLALMGTAAELGLVAWMEHRLDELAEPYHHGAAGAYGQLARALTVSGSLLLAAAGRRRRLAATGGSALLLAGAACERWSVFKAGFQSARDPKYTVGPQRRRVEGGRGQGASRHVSSDGSSA